MKKTVLMSAAKKARIALAVLAVCGFTLAGTQSAFAAIEVTGTNNTITDAKDSSTVIGTENKLKGEESGGEKVEFNVLKSRNTLASPYAFETNTIYGTDIDVSSSYTSGNVIFGHDIKLSGYAYNSVVVGSDNELSGGGAHAVVVGKHIKSQSYWGVAIGFQSELGDMASITLGTHSTATGENSDAFGKASKATGKYSVALGDDSTANGDYTVSVGGMHQVQVGNEPSGAPIIEEQWLRRRITNVADGDADSDAATVGQVKSMIAAGGAGSTLTQEQFNTMLDANTKFTGLQTEVGNKANANGDNITTGTGSQWANKLGTGAIANGDKNLVNGETVYNKIGDTSQLAGLGNNLSDAVVKVNTKAETAQTTATDALDKANTNATNIGNLGELNTTNKGNLVGAVNEVNGKTKENAKAIEKVNGRVDELGGRVSKLDSKVNKVGAGAAALAALHPMEFDSDNKLTFAAGVGSYQGASAAALGAFYRPSEQVMFSIAGNMGNGENMVNAGVSFALDRPSKTPTTKAMMAKKLAEQEQMLAEQSREIAELKAMVQQLAAKQNA